MGKDRSHRGGGRAHLSALAALLLCVPPGGAQEPRARLALNIPAYELRATTGGAETRLRVAIGARAYPTPAGRFTLTDITWNPWWYPPKRAWAANDTITPPCPINPMGRVKLSFGRGYFIHGTPKPRSIGRASSHGCVRADNADVLALAAAIVRVTMPESLASVEQWAGGSSTRRLHLAAPVPLEIRYDLAEVRGDSLILYPDVYRRVPATARRVALAMAALAAHADTSALDARRLRSLVERSRRERVAEAVSSLTSRLSR